MSEVLAQRDRALDPEETAALLRERFGERIDRAVVEYGLFTLWIDVAAWREVFEACRDERLLAYDLFDCLFGIDAGQEGFDVVAVLYSTSTGNRLALRTRCDGGRDAPRCPSVTAVYRGADWMERETYDLFGIVFDEHPGLEPRLLTVENFDGWPLRKDFHLASRVAKPWPGVKEPAELDEDGNVIEREPGIGDAPGPYDLDKAMAEHAKAVNAPPSVEPGEDAQDADQGGQSDGDGAAETGDGDTPQDPPAADADAGGGQAADPAASAKARAEERRRKQAEARAAKARERAERAAKAKEQRDGEEPGSEEGA